MKKNIPIVKGKINIIANTHASFLAYKNCGMGMVIGIKPPNLIRERYGIEENVIWLTYFPQGYNNAYSPDRFEFEVMDRIARFLEGGGECILVEGVEYLAMKFGKKKVYELIRRIKNIKEEVTIIVGVNDDVEEWRGVGDYIYEERMKIRDAKVKIVDRIKEGDKVIISLKGGENRINLEEYGDVNGFLFDGIDRIIRSGKKNVGIECTDYLLTTLDEKSLFTFFKDLIDIVVYNGGEIEVKKDDKIYSSPLLILFEYTGLESEEIFVGREKEMEKLRDMLNLKGEKMMLISGEVGIGKTTLVMRFKNYAIMKGFKFLSSRCYYDVNDPYLPILDALGNYVGGLKSDGFKPDDKKRFEAQRNTMFYDFADRIRKFTKDKKIILFFDDMQWMDYSSLRLLHYLASNLKDENIVFIGSYRPEETKKEFKEVIGRMLREKLYNEMKLNGLKYEETKELIENIIGERVPDRFTRLIYDKTEGNPLFTKELINHLINIGLLDLERKNYPMEIDVELPDLIREIVNRKLEKLNDEERRVVEIASVIGYRVDPNILLEISGIDEFKLFDTVENLEKNGIIKEDEKGEEYVFSERIIRDGIYDRILKRKRKILHRKVAETIEKLYEGDKRYYGELGRHYEKSGDKNKAWGYYMKAGEEAEKIYGHEDAIKYYEKALKLSGEDKKIDVYEKLGEVYEIIGNFDIAASYYFEALKICKGEKKSDIMMRIGELYEKIGKYEHAMKYYEDALKYVKEDSVIRGRIYNSMGWVEFQKGNYDKGIGYARKAIKIVEGKDKKELAYGFHLMGTIYLYMGNYGEALKFLKKAIEIREKIEDLRGLTESYNNTGIVYYYMGKIENSLEYYEKTLEMVTKMGDKYAMSLSYNNIAIIYRNKGETDKAIEYFKKSIEICKKIENTHGLGYSLMNLGRIYIKMGNIDKGIEYYEKSLKIFKSIEHKFGIANIYDNFSSLYLELENFGKGIEYANKGIEISNEIGAKNELLYGFCNISEIYSLKGNYEKGLEYGKKALSIAEEIKSDRYIMMSYRAIGIAYREKGDYDKGEEYLKKSIEISKELDIKEEYAINLYELGLLYRKKGDEKWKVIMEEAKKIFEEMRYMLYVNKINRLIDER